MTTTIKLKNGLESTRTTITPIVGEPIISYDANSKARLYIGDGTTAGGQNVALQVITDVRAQPNGIAPLNASKKLELIYLPDTASIDLCVGKIGTTHIADDDLPLTDDHNSAEIHFEGLGDITLDGDSITTDTFVCRIVNTDAGENRLVATSNFEGVFIRDGSSVIFTGTDLTVRPNETFLLSVTNNEGNKYLNIFPTLGIHTHPISDVVNLQSDLDLKAPLESPELTGTPTAPTPSISTYTDQIATTKFTKDLISDELFGVLDYRTSFDPAVESGSDGFPTTGGSGASGEIMKGNVFIVASDGYLTTEAVFAGDIIIANINDPGQILNNWDIVERNITYVPEDVINKVSNFQVTPDNTHYPTEKLVKDKLDLKEVLANKVTAFQVTPDNTHYPTEKLVKDTLDLKEVLVNKTTSFQVTPDNTHYPTEKLVKDTLDLKEVLVNKVSDFQATPDNTHYPTEKLVKDTLDLKEVLVNKVSDFQATPDNTHYPTEKLVKDTLDLKINTTIALISRFEEMDASSVETLHDTDLYILATETGEFINFRSLYI